MGNVWMVSAIAVRQFDQILLDESDKPWRIEEVRITPICDFSGVIGCEHKPLIWNVATFDYVATANKDLDALFDSHPDVLAAIDWMSTHHHVECLGHRIAFV